jgi:peptide deformylase
MAGPNEREEILLLGDPRLRRICDLVLDFQAPECHEHASRLQRALEQFRAEHGFGRALSAPQIGIPRRMIAMNLGEGPFLLVNPEFTGRSARMFTLWDDCMSFPWLMVRLERHLHVDLTYQDETGRQKSWPGVEMAVSELLQHEVDHLNGVLAIDRALDREALIARTVYIGRKAYFDSLVDYAITPTIR